MSKKIAKVVKLEIPGGQAKPGPKLASAGIMMPKFCTDFNAKTADRQGVTVPVIITAYEDKSFDYVIKTTPVAELLFKEAGVKKETRWAILGGLFIGKEIFDHNKRNATHGHWGDLAADVAGTVASEGVIWVIKKDF